MPRDWAHYRGLYRHGDRVILAYTVGTADVLDMPGLETDPARPGAPIFTRTLEVGPSNVALTMLVCPFDGRPRSSPAIPREPGSNCADGSIVLKLSPWGTSRVVKVLMSDGDASALAHTLRHRPAPRRRASSPEAARRDGPSVLKTPADDRPRRWTVRRRRADTPRK